APGPGRGRGQRQARAAEIGLRGREIRVVDCAQIPQPAPKIELPGSRDGEAVALRGSSGARAVARGAPSGRGVGTDSGKMPRPSDDAILFGASHSRRRRFQVTIVSEGFIDRLGETSIRKLGEPPGADPPFMAD